MIGHSDLCVAGELGPDPLHRLVGIQPPIFGQPTELGFLPAGGHHEPVITVTGVIVHESGLVITRGSVTLEEVSAIKCHLHDGRRMMAEIVREDRRTKMVLLRLMGDPGEKFPAAALGKSASVYPGQFILLIGNAYKVARGKEKCAVNFGIVSAVTKMAGRLGMSDFKYRGKVILHDAMNNPGVYGGPLVNLKGEVVGISGRLVESKETNAQVHYAIPIDDLRPFIKDTLARPEASRVYAPGGTDTIDPNAAAAVGFHGIRILKGGIIRATPAFVDRVIPGSPAAKAGALADDLILRVDDSRVKTWKSFKKLMGTYRVGDIVKLTVKRKHEVKLIVLTLIAEPKR